MKSRHFEKLIILLLIGIFAVCIVLSLFMGSNTYRRLTERGRISGDRRTCALYLTTKIRQSDCIESVYTEPFGENDALVLKEMINGTAYLTRIYEFDGSLTELLSPETAELSPSDGTPVMKISELSFSYDGGLVKMTYADENGKDTELFVSLRSKGVSK